jgi:hypothetical protein
MTPLARIREKQWIRREAITGGGQGQAFVVHTDEIQKES